MSRLSVTSAERGHTHTVLSCISASGFVLPPCIVYPRKKRVPENLREGAVAGTVFCNSDNGWINAEIYLEWFNNFLKSIPPARPVVLIQDGHASQISIELIELARSNGVHILCLPAHTTHLLQPLDVGVFKSFKVFFSKACSSYLSKHPGRVITTDMIASLVSSAYRSAFTPTNIIAGFRKTGVFPLNPGVIDDKMLSPSLAFNQQQQTISPNPEQPNTSSDKAATSPSTGASVDSSSKLVQEESPSSSKSDHESTSVKTACSLYTAEQQKLYERRYEEGYDVQDPEYEAWLKITHPMDTRSVVSSSASVKMSNSASSCSDILHEMLVLPEPKQLSKKKKKGLNAKCVCITEESVLDNLKAQKLQRKKKSWRRRRGKLNAKSRRKLRHWRWKEEMLQEKKKEKLRSWNAKGRKSKRRKQRRKGAQEMEELKMIHSI